MALKIGACGDNCSDCPRYNATINNNTDELNRVKDLWVTLGWRQSDVDAKSLKCTGCHIENKCAYAELQTCVFNNKFENCGECSHYPCELTEDAFTRTDTVLLKCKNVISDYEMQLLRNAFGRKKEILDHLHSSSCR